MYAVVPDVAESVPENIADHVSDQQAASRLGGSTSDSDPELQEALRASVADAPHVTVSQDVRCCLQTPTRRRAREYGSDEDVQRQYRLRSDSPPPRRRRGRANRADSSSADDTDEMLADYVRRSPFLNPIATSLVDDDVEELESEPEITRVSHAPQAVVVDDADDQDEELQAVLAASLGHPYELSSDAIAQLQRLEQAEPAPAPVPPDVQRIREMRERARANPEQAREHDPGTMTPKAPESNAPPQDGDSDSDSPEAPSAEEMRRRRLARAAL